MAKRKQRPSSIPSKPKAAPTAKKAPVASPVKSSPPLESYLVHLYLVVMFSIQFVPLLNALDTNINKWLLINICNGLFWLLLLINYKRWGFNTALLNQWNVLLFGAFLLWAIVSFVNVINYGEAFTGLVRYGTMIGVILSYMVILDRKPEMLDFAARVVVVFLLLDGYFYLTEYFEKMYKVADADVALVRSFYDNKNQIAISHLIKLPFAVYLFLTDRSVWRTLSGLAVFSVMLVIALVLARSVFVTLAVVLVFGLLSYLVFGRHASSYRPIWRSAFLLTFSTLVLGFVMGYGIQQLQQVPEKQRANLGTDLVSKVQLSVGAASEGNLRIFLWKKSIEMIRDYPIFGVGVNNWKVHFPDYDAGFYKTGTQAPRRAHNDLLQVAAEMGLPGALIFMAIFFVSFVYVYRISKIPDEKIESKYKIFSFLCLAGMLGYAGPSMFSFPLERATHHVFLLFFLGATAAFHQRALPRRELGEFPTQSFLLGVTIFMLFAFYVHKERFVSYRIQNSILPDVTTGRYAMPLPEVEKSNRFFASISADGTESLLSMKARYLIHQKKWEEARDVMLEALETNPYFYKNHVILALIHYNMNDCENTKKYADDVIRKRPLIDMYQLLHVCALREGNQGRADSLLVELVERNPESGKAWVFYADRLIGQNQLDSAERLLDRGRDFYISKPNMEDSYVIWEKSVILCFSQKKYQKADSLSTIMTEYYPAEPNVYANRGSARVNLKQYKEAIQDFDRTMALKPDHYLAIQNRGVANYMLNNDKACIADLQKVVDGQKDETPSQAYYFKGLAHQRLDQLNEACEALQKAAAKGYPGADNLANIVCNVAKNR